MRSGFDFVEKQSFTAPQLPSGGTRAGWQEGHGGSEKASHVESEEPGVELGTSGVRNLV